MATARVLWVFEHAPSAVELQVLARKYGQDVVINHVPPSTTMATALVDQYRGGDYCDIAAERSLILLVVLYLHGIKPLLIDSIVEDDPTRVDFRDERDQGRRFMAMRRLDAIAVATVSY